MTLSEPCTLLRRARRAVRYRIAARRNEYWQRRFVAASPDDYLVRHRDHVWENLSVFSLAGAQQFPLQVLSLLSFLSHAGRPKQWTVVSDGTLTDAQAQTLREFDSSVEIRPWQDLLTEQNRVAATLYAGLAPLGKKLAVVTGMPTDRFSLYVDSDILFFSGAPLLQKILDRPRANYFVQDCGNATLLDLATIEEHRLTPLNSGFLIQGLAAPWDGPLARLAELLTAKPETGRGNHFLEQTVVHLAYHAMGAQMLDSCYVINLSDAFEAEDRFCGPDIVNRHYLCQTRPKFWGHAKDYLRSAARD